MTTHIPIIAATISSAGWTISIIAILVVVAIAWKEFGGKHDLERVRRRRRRRGSPH
jgi:hypothetical protein